MSAVDEVRVLQEAMNQKSSAFAAILELAERVKALEDLTKRHLRLHIKEELVEPPTAPDLDAKIIDCLSEIESWYSIQRKPGPTINIVPSLEKILRAFAAELGVR